MSLPVCYLFYVCGEKTTRLCICETGSTSETGWRHVSDRWKMLWVQRDSVGERDVLEMFSEHQCLSLVMGYAVWYILRYSPMTPALESIWFWCFSCVIHNETEQNRSAMVQQKFMTWRFVVNTQQCLHANSPQMIEEKWFRRTRGSRFEFHGRLGSDTWSSLITSTEAKTISELKVALETIGAICHRSSQQSLHANSRWCLIVTLFARFRKWLRGSWCVVNLK